MCCAQYYQTERCTTCTTKPRPTPYAQTNATLTGPAHRHRSYSNRCRCVTKTWNHGSSKRTRKYNPVPVSHHLFIFPLGYYVFGWVPKGSSYLLAVFEHHPSTSSSIRALKHPALPILFVDLSDAYALELYNGSPCQTFSYRVNIGRGHASLHLERFKIKLRSSSGIFLSLNWSVFRPSLRAVGFLRLQE